MKDKETPLKLVRLWPKMLPGCYETLDYMKDAKPEGQVDWPAYCELPINAAFTYLVETGESENIAAAGAPELTACYLWRKNKIIFAFDPDLTATLEEQAKETEETVCCLYHQKKDFISVPYEPRNADYLKKNKSE